MRATEAVLRHGGRARMPGERGVMLVQSELEGREELDVAAQRLYRFGFDRVVLPQPTLGYEPRSSCRCESCAALWVGSKSGPVMRIDLRFEAGPRQKAGEARQTFLSGNREARAVHHLHGCAALTGRGRDPASFLLVGRDDGVLDIVRTDLGFQPWPPRQDRHAPGAGFHLDSWARRPGREPVAVDGYVPRSTSGNEQAMGITAIEAIADVAQPDAMLILVATRYPQLFILRAQGGELELCGSIAMPGWIDWIVRPEELREDVLCVSRGGDIARLPLALLARTRAAEGPIKPEQLDPGAVQSLSLHPTAVLPFGERGLLVGTQRGLTLVRDAVSAPVAVPVTRSAVLCLDRAWMPGAAGDVHYVTMGLEDGRLRVLDARMIDALGRGAKLAPDLHRFSVEMGDSVLAVETLRIAVAGRDSSAAVAFVLAMLHDHSLCLFKVAGLGAQNAAALDAWHRHVRSSEKDPAIADPADDFDAAWRIANELARADGERAVRSARRYLLVEVVLRELRRLAGERADHQRKLVELAITLASADDPQVLRALSLAIGRIAGGNVEAVLELSRAVLRGLAAVRRADDDGSAGAFAPDGARPGVTVGGPRRWATVVSSHLGELLRLARDATGDDRTRLVSWARFVRKYIVRGHTFATKKRELASLVAQNHASGKYFDALIYQARLAQRCYDVQWELALGVGIAQLHPARFRPPQAIVVCVTADARVVFVGPDGKRLPVLDDRPGFAGAVLRAATPFDTRAQDAHGFAAHHWTLTSTVKTSNHGALIIVAADGDALPTAGLAVLDVVWGDTACAAVRVRCVEHVSCDQPTARVHALHALGNGGVFIAGLESPDDPVGKLWYSIGERGAWRWSLELAGEGRALQQADELSAVAPGKVPTRALAVAPHRGIERYLVVAGSDDGRVRAFSCSASDRAASWQIDRWDQATNAVTSIALGAHDTLRRREVAFTCYLSTASAETLALSIVTSDARRPRTFTGYEALPLWRDTHAGAVMAMRLWSMPRYEDGAVLAVATQHGSLVLYNHAWLEGDGDDRVSATMNYWFRGKRLARLTLPGPLTAVGMVEGQSEILAAGPHGRLYSASLMFLPDSNERDEPEPPPGTLAAASARSPAASHDHEPALPPGMWAQLRHLLARSEIDWMLRPAPEDRLPVKLALCELVPVDAVSNYALHQTVEPRSHLHGRDAAALWKRAHELLDPLDPDRPADAAHIKLILRSLSRTFLSRNPDEVAQAICDRHWQRHDETATACEIVAEYLRHALVLPTPAAARLRVVAMKELLRVGLLHHMSRQDAISERIRNAVEGALTGCLRDDNRIVRIETLRALSVMLRNVRVMAKRRSEVTGALFPRGLGSLTWALDPVVARLARFPSRRTGSALASSAWYRTSVLTHVFRLFPRRTLALCDYVTRARRCDDTVRVCDDLLRRPGPPGDDEPRGFAAKFELYLLRPLEHAGPDGASDLERYATAPERRSELGLAAASDASAVPAATQDDAWYAADDSGVAECLLQRLGVMARMWNATTADGVADALAAARARPSLPPMAARVPLLDAVEGAVEALIDLGDRLGLGNDRAPGELLKRTDPLARIRDAVPSGFATLVTGILETWHTAFLAPPSTGRRIGRYRLGTVLVDDGTRREFAVDDPPQLGDFAIKVMWPAEPIGHERFLPGARLNHRLARTLNPGSRVVEVIDVLAEPCPAYVMRRHDEWLDIARVRSWQEPDRIVACERIAEDIGRALQAVHAEPDGWHGAVKPCNIAVIRNAGRLEFRLGHFDRGYRFRGAAGDATAYGGVDPGYLVLHAAGDETVECRRWEDVVGLLLLLYELLTGNIVHPAAFDLRRHRQALDAVDESIAARPRTRGILTLLRRLFADEVKPFTARDVVDALSPAPAPPPPPRPWVLPRHLAILCVGAAPPTQELRIARELQQIQSHLSNSVHGKECHPIPCGGALTDIVNALDGGGGELIVHFSCHGHPGELLLPRGPAWTRRPTPAIVEIFRNHGRRVRGVVLSACHAHELAEELRKVVDVVVYGVGAVPDEAALAFTAFYKSLADGEAVNTACHRGNLHVRELGDVADCRDIVQCDCVPGGGDAFKVLTREDWAQDTVRFFEGQVHPSVTGVS